ncbi:DEAD/DEAH box helicase family protein [uncultured Thiocystis sp.]|jgi:type III restriction enzyme|uniref:DEAD/DEAH box helicase n=1 Tax=uncultured Thiocystis sp. TaxID=1202134 RepID=UPI0025D14BC2|nr:DEAD/DEAH box helicase family protein [uncultured Thiocystis sp.]
MRDLDYQARVLTLFDAYLTELSAQKKRADGIADLARQQPDLGLDIPDFAANAWNALKTAGRLPPSRAAIPYSPRLDGIGRATPNAVFKVPTGGGKTYLAVSALSRLCGRYLGRNTGFVLWIVPNEAIYSQTRRQLTDRQHPYRQMLDRAAAGRVRILEKTDPLDARDVESHLCVMLLMLPSANRQSRESLKMFRDRGDVRGFFPPEGDVEAHRLVLDQIPNLDAYGTSAESGAFWPLVKDSLGNALRLIRPVVVMDEGHKAISELAFATLYGFNPCFVLELTATPKDVAARGGANPRPARHANILVEVAGTELDREGMIKMPLNLDPRQGTDWRNTLSAALDCLNRLQVEARRLHGERGRYIRPILLVQVERTGRDQRDGVHIHALDAKDWLLTAGLDEAEIAIKTADTNELANPENQDLLAPTNRVRVIVTKQALQEGWDCPFAYVLCALAASQNLSALTQLVGRILRQPQADKTGIPLLDESYVITHHAATAGVVEAIKTGLQEDGLGDLVKELRISGDSGNPDHGSRSIPRREAFAKTEIYLPRVLAVEGGRIRPLDYEQDILFYLDWSALDPAPLIAHIPDNAQSAEQQMRRFRLADVGEERILDEISGHSVEMLRFDPAYAVRMVSDLVPNPWIAREIVGRLLAGLTARGFDAETLGAVGGLIVEQLRRWLDGERDRMAEAVFRAAVAEGRIQFRLRTDDHNWRMPFMADTYEPEGAEQLIGKSGGPLQKSLFAPLYKGDFSSQDERNIAVYLDSEATLTWWHRNVARQQYGIQGWRRGRIYPDFIFALQRARETNRVVVLETKGPQLAGNLDTEYKQAVLRLMSDHYAIESPRVGELELVDPGGTVVHCDLLLMPDWKTRLPNEFLRK